MAIYDAKLSADKSLKIYKLRRNPFDNISSDNMTPDEIIKIHVETDADDIIINNFSNILDGGTATIALIGEYGSGKSLRAKGIQETLKNRDALVFYTKLPGGTPGMVTYALFESVCVPLINNNDISDDLRDFARNLWENYRGISNISDAKFKPYKAGQDLASLFKRISEEDVLSGLVIDEFEEIIEASIQRDVRKTFEILREYLSYVDNVSGHITVICSTPNAWATLKEIHPAVATRIHVEIEFKPIRDKTAIEIVRKRLAAFRTDGSDNLEPFTDAIIKKVNKEYATGNPRMLLVVLRSILTVAAKVKLKQVTVDSIKDGVNEARENLKNHQRERIKQILTPKMRNILDVIINDKNGGPVVGTELAEELNMDQGNLSRYLNQMTTLNFLNKDREGRIVSYEIKPELRLVFAEELGLMEDK
ncbi:MAG: AAA family ATPase [Asgard group archaeon]|nr:AAA family ATPase [Asgard group archaeon]